MTHECVFVEERTVSGRLILPPCLVCGTTAMDALAQLRNAERDGLIKAARYFEYEMAPAWGGDTTWISTGSHVADLVAEILRNLAEETAK